MKTWNIPVAVAERFAANEYVSACYRVRCSVDGEKTGYLVVAVDVNGNGMFDEGVDTALWDRRHDGKKIYCCGTYHDVILNTDIPTVANGVVVRASDGANIPVYMWVGDDLGYPVPAGNTPTNFHVTNLARAEEYILLDENPNHS